MTKQETNLAKLPEFCYSVLYTTNELIILKRGEEGYYATDYAPAKNAAAAEEWCNTANERIGVTKAQRKAMEMGSMWGFDIPGADPDHYINKNI